MMKKVLILIASSIILIGCSSALKTANDGHNAQNSLDYMGIYQGVLPCADCEGISTTILLDSDHRYELTTRYLGKRKTLKESQKGTFLFDPSGNIIILAGKERPNSYFVAENRLFSLDIKGKKIEGPLAENYILNKK